MNSPMNDIGEKEPQYETAYAKFQNWQNLHILRITTKEIEPE